MLQQLTAALYLIMAEAVLTTCLCCDVGCTPRWPCMRLLPCSLVTMLVAMLPCVGLERPCAATTRANQQHTRNSLHSQHHCRHTGAPVLQHNTMHDTSCKPHGACESLPRYIHTDLPPIHCCLMIHASLLCTMFEPLARQLTETEQSYKATRPQPLHASANQRQSMVTLHTGMARAGATHIHRV